jgi:hypothetical protein
MQVYEKLTVIFREETSGQYITCMFMQVRSHTLVA